MSNDNVNCKIDTELIKKSLLWITQVVLMPLVYVNHI